MSTPPSEDVRLAEFTTLRQEIAQRATLQQALVALNVTVVGAISGLVVSHPEREGLFVVVAFASSIFGLLWVDHHANISRIALYVKDELWIWRPSWEERIRELEHPAWWSAIYLALPIAIFVAMAVAALIISFRELEGTLILLWWLAAIVAAGAAVAFCLRFIRAPW